METEKEKKQIQWDKLFSTFYWKIYLTESNEAEIFNGYSKVLNQAEAQDKDYLLTSKIVMIHKYGYLNPSRVKKIEFFFRSGDMINQRNDLLLLELMPDRYNIPQGPNQQWILKKFGVFLEQFFIAIRKGENPQTILKSRKKPVNNDDFLNIDRIEFRDLQHLYSYSVRLLNHNHPPGIVEQFIFKVKSKYNWLETTK